MTSKTHDKTTSNKTLQNAKTLRKTLALPEQPILWINFQAWARMVIFVTILDADKQKLLGLMILPSGAVDYVLQKYKELV